MDVQKRALIGHSLLGLVLLCGLLLRLKGIHNPLLDHPGWRQGDTASIARNFVLLQFNPLYPQTNYDGPPPNYVELELQIVPFLAATLYKIFGIHEIFGRLISIAFSLGTIAVLGLFARWLFASEVAGIAAALAFAIEPGSFYYARTFTPDTTMVFFLTAALYAFARLIVDDEAWTVKRIIAASALLAAALLAKPVAIVALVPIAALLVRRALAGRTMPWTAIALSIALPLLVLFAYDRAVASHAEWHWASGITGRHVMPNLRASLSNGAAFVAKLQRTKGMLTVFWSMMIGVQLAVLAVAGMLFLPAQTRSRTLLWSWLIGGLAYVFAVVTVERVDYYMYLLLPLAALACAAIITRMWQLVEASPQQWARVAFFVLALPAAGEMTYQNRHIVAPYYRYSRQVYRNAVALDALLDKNALVVMGHYDPSVLYYIGRYGWEEDPYLWTTFDEQSAIKKGARYFIDIERNRFAKNVELCAWMQRFPLVDTHGAWTVFHTDPSLVKPAAEKQWRDFRNAEKAGRARDWLDRRGLCGKS